MKTINYENYFWQDDLVRLRAIQESDWEDSYRNRFDSKAGRLLQYEIELPPTISEEKTSIAKYVDFAPETNRLMFAIETLDGKSVGGLNLNSIDERNGTFSIGMQIHCDQRGKGYGTAAMRVLLKYAFFERRLNKYYGSILKGNIASEKMLLRLGCRIEGTRKEMVFAEGRYQDIVLFGLTRKEFEHSEKSKSQE